MSVCAREFAVGRAYMAAAGLAFPAGAAVQSTSPEAGPASVPMTAEVANGREAAEVAGKAAGADRFRPQLSLLQPRHRTATEPVPMIPRYRGPSG